MTTPDTAACAFCVTGTPTHCVVGADGRDYLVCRSCVHEAEEFGIDEHWQSYTLLSRECHPMKSPGGTDEMATQ